MTGRSSRSAGRALAANPPPVESQTQENSSQGSRQGEQVGVVPNSGAANPHNDNVNVRAPMSLDQMRRIINSEVLSTEQLQVLADRVRELARAYDGTSRKRSRDYIR
jgi:hypothetical protein